MLDKLHAKCADSDLDRFIEIGEEKLVYINRRDEIDVELG